MLLVTDIGNTRIKWAVFEQNILKFYFVEEGVNFFSSVSKIFRDYPLITHWYVSSVGKYGKEELLKHASGRELKIVSHEDVWPFVNRYKTPATLGLDRLVLAAGAVLQYPKVNRLVIDAGTCITYDFIDDQDQYWGGAISPGVEMRYKALHNYTSRLPLLEKEWPESAVGSSTAGSIHSGVVWGVIHEIEGFIGRITENKENFTIILTGGDSDFLAKRLKNTIFANPNFLLESLNLIFQYTSKK